MNENNNEERSNKLNEHTHIYVDVSLYLHIDYNGLLLK